MIPSYEETTTSSVSYGQLDRVLRTAPIWQGRGGGRRSRGSNVPRCSRQGTCRGGTPLRRWICAGRHLPREIKRETSSCAFGCSKRAGGVGSNGFISRSSRKEGRGHARQGCVQWANRGPFRSCCCVITTARGCAWHLARVVKSYVRLAREDQ